MKLFFLIRSLNPGGAERQLTNLANGLAARGHAVHVAVLYSGGRLESDLNGPTLHCLNKAGRWDMLNCFFRLVRLIRSLSPDVAHGYLGTANVLLAAAKPFLKGTKVFWGVRASAIDRDKYSFGHKLHWKSEILFSTMADAIIYNSMAGRAHAEESGFAKEYGTVIYNGIDTDRFRPNPDGGKRMREQWSIPADAPLIGLPARLDPLKDHPTFLQAAAMLAGERDDVRFVCIGEGCLLADLQAMATQLNLNDRLVWAGHVSDMSAAYSALTLSCLSSVTESFPNTLGEAMACGVPCVATDVGDVRHILGDKGLIVPARNPERFFRALEKGLATDMTKTDARATIAARFPLGNLIAKTEALLFASKRQHEREEER